MRQNGAGGHANTTTAPQSSRLDPCTRDSRNPIERPGNFPSSYVASTHRHDWLAKFDEAEAADEEIKNDDSLMEDFVVVSPSEVDRNISEDSRVNVEQVLGLL